MPPSKVPVWLVLGVMACILATLYFVAIGSAFSLVSITVLVLLLCIDKHQTSKKEVN